MRIFALIAALALVSTVPVQAGEGRSLSLSGVDQKLPGSLGKAAATPTLVEVPKPPEPPRPPEAPKVTETPAAAAPAQAVEAPNAPAFVQRPSVATRPAESREGQVTFEDNKPAPSTAPSDKPKQAKADQPKRKRANMNEARIMREIYRYGGYAAMLGGW